MSKRKCFSNTLFPIACFAAILFLPELAIGQSGEKNNAAPQVQQQTVTRGILDQQAPEWTVDQWQQLPAATQTLSVKDYQGKIVYAYFFQAWCPGCHSIGFPNLKEVQKHFSGDDDVAFVAIQTVFEGKSTNTSKRALETAQKFELGFPIGHAVTPAKDREHPQIMSDYRTGGTPWTVIIDRTGIVRANDFTIKPKTSIDLISQLKKQ